MTASGWVRVGMAAAVAFVAGSAPAGSQVTDARAAAAGLRFAPLRFQAPEPRLHEVQGVPVFFLEDRSVPLVNVLARFEGGYGLFPRDLYAAGTALPALLRYGGTQALPPDSVDLLLEYYALQTSFGGGGESVFSSMNTLSEHLAETLDLWAAMLRTPRFDSAQVEVWRGRELDAVRRLPEDPQRLAFSEFNRLLYGDHPVGWEMGDDDLTPAVLTIARLRQLHARILCRDNLMLGVTGDVSWSEMKPLLERMLRGWPRCGADLPEGPEPDIRDTGGVFLISRPLEQSVLVLAHPTEVNLGDADYFAAQIGNTVLGAGGFSSRLLARVRTEEGYAYSAASLWTTPRKYKGLVGAVTRTRPEAAASALGLILEILQGMRDGPPSRDEVDTAVDQIANGFVFNFETAAQIISRRMSFLSQDLPDDWLEDYLRGVQDVTPAAVQEVFRKHLRPGDMTILVVGDPLRMDMAALGALGPVTLLEPGGR
ncbi:MAG: pitrilysin family protein [Longimicrobiales bacterium]|nr:pitrilysin family protein [Longimicrobiales bacterium]